MPEFTFSQTVALATLKDLIGEEAWRLAHGLVLEIAEVDLDTGEVLRCDSGTGWRCPELLPCSELKGFVEEAKAVGSEVLDFDPAHAEIDRLQGELAAANLLVTRLQKENEKHLNFIDDVSGIIHCRADDFDGILAHVQSLHDRCARKNDELQESQDRLRRVLGFIADGPTQIPFVSYESCLTIVERLRKSAVAAVETTVERVPDAEIPEAARRMIEGAGAPPIIAITPTEPLDPPSDGGRPSQGKLEPDELSYREMLSEETLERLRQPENGRTNGVPSTLMPKVPRPQHGHPMLDEPVGAEEVKLRRLPKENQPWMAQFDPAIWESLMRGLVDQKRPLEVCGLLNQGLTPGDAQWIKEATALNFFMRADTKDTAAYVRQLSEHDRQRWFKRCREINEGRYAKKVSA